MTNPLVTTLSHATVSLMIAVCVLGAVGSVGSVPPPCPIEGFLPFRKVFSFGIRRYTGKSWGKSWSERFFAFRAVQNDSKSPTEREEDRDLVSVARSLWGAWATERPNPKLLEVRIRRDATSDRVDCDRTRPNAIPSLN